MNQAAVEHAASTSTRTQPRIEAVASIDPSVAERVTHLAELAERGLAASFDAATGTFAQTVRGITGEAGVRIEPEGHSRRYAAIAALGLSRLPLERQRAVLAGMTAEELTVALAKEVVDADDLGEAALAAWALAEVAHTFPTDLLGRLAEALESGRPVPTVAVAWSLTAAVKSAPYGLTERLVKASAQLLRSHLGPGGTYPHMLPPTGQRWRGHVGSFADQVYPLQALALAGNMTGDAWMLAAADHTARQLCGHQGAAGQWWWHYDARDGSIVERFPVYSVHQHAMAPMVLLDLRDSGGQDLRTHVARGLGWLDTHPEVVEELVSERFGLIWRKVGRREPRKAARGLGALTTSVRPGLHLPGVDRLLPPGVVDHECRPYELGWLLYAWLAPDAGAEHE